MAIDIATEKVLTLSQARQHVPQRRAGKRPDLATMYRWTNQGCGGVQLEWLMCGATRCTSLQAMQRFFDRLTEVEKAKRSAPADAPAALSKTRQRDVDGAERRLAKKRSAPRGLARATP